VSGGTNTLKVGYVSSKGSAQEENKQTKDNGRQQRRAQREKNISNAQRRMGIRRAMHGDHKHPVFVVVTDHS
jgi:hypothetical protein